MVQTALDLVSQAFSAVLAGVLLLFALYDRGRVREAARRHLPMVALLSLLRLGGGSVRLPQSVKPS